MTAAPSSEPRAPSARRSKLFWGAALVVLAFDLWTKHAVFEHLGVDPGTMSTRGSEAHEPFLPEIFGGKVELIALLNPGMMWGAFHDHPTVLKIVRPVAVLVIFLLLSSLPAGQRAARVALGGILGGAVGNLIDRARFGAVVDFLDFYVGEYHWPAFNVADSALSVDLGVPVFNPFPAFNVADSAICIGVALLLWDGLRSGARASEAAPSQEKP